jgi:hypothetical protein
MGDGLVNERMSIGAHCESGEGIQHWSMEHEGGRTECMREHQDAIARAHTYIHMATPWKSLDLLSTGSRMLYIETNVDEQQAHGHLESDASMVPPETSFNASTATLINEAHDQTQPEDCK